MTRRSRLGVVVRLAEIEQRERLRALAVARAAADGARAALAGLERALALAVRGRAPAPGTATPVAELRANTAHVRALGLRRTAGIRVAANAERVEDVARDSVVRTRLRVRALRRAVARREERSALAARQREQRRLDETARGQVPEDRDA